VTEFTRMILMIDWLGRSRELGGKSLVSRKKGRSEMDLLERPVS
jgi:hypothetical protein